MGGRLGDVLAGGQVDDPVGLVAAEQVAHGGAVAHVGAHQRDPERQAGGAPGRQVVDDDRFDSGLAEGGDDVRADVPGASSDKPSHVGGNEGLSLRIGQLSFS
ncbi:hypothetical protein GCM10027610_128360 [Dactylosporangium cerinum]